MIEQANKGPLTVDTRGHLTGSAMRYVWTPSSWSCLTWQTNIIYIYQNNTIKIKGQSEQGPGVLGALWLHCLPVTNVIQHHLRAFFKIPLDHILPCKDESISPVIAHVTSRRLLNMTVKSKSVGTEHLFDTQHQHNSTKNTVHKWYSQIKNWCDGVRVTEGTFLSKMNGPGLSRHGI